MGASSTLIDRHPQIVQAMTDLMTAACTWSNANKAKAAEITAKWIGVPTQAIAKSTIIYTTRPSANWLRGEAIFMDILNDMHKLKGRFKAKTLKETEADIFDFRFVRTSLEKS